MRTDRYRSSSDCSAAPACMRSIRIVSVRTALRENDNTRISAGRRPCDSRYARRWATTSVLPVPGPASTMARVLAALCAMALCLDDRTHPGGLGTSFSLCAVGRPIAMSLSFGRIPAILPVWNGAADANMIQDVQSRSLSWLSSEATAAAPVRTSGTAVQQHLRVISVRVTTPVSTSLSSASRTDDCYRPCRFAISMGLMTRTERAISSNIHGESWSSNPRCAIAHPAMKHATRRNLRRPMLNSVTSDTPDLSPRHKLSTPDK